MPEYYSDYSGETAQQDMEACAKAMAILQKHYPDHPWLIGCDHQAGAVHVRLQYTSHDTTTHRESNGYGFLLYISTILGGEGERKIMLAGGECLERFQLSRTRATDQSALRAAENGLDLSNIITKSRN